MTISQFLGVVEARTKVVSISTLAGGTVFALRKAGRLDFLALALTIPAVLLVDMGTTAFNSFFDYWRGDDRGGRLREPDKVLVTEGVPALAAFIVAAGCYAVAACLGLVLALRAGAWVVGWGALCLAAGFSYNGGPRPVSRTPLGELVAGGFLGSALFLIAYRLQAGGLGTKPLFASIPGALFIASILSVNNACDMEGDLVAGRRTLAIILGRRRAAYLPVALAAGSYVATLGAALSGVVPIGAAAAGAATALASVPIYARMLKRGFSHDTKGANMRAVLGAFALWSLGFVAGIAFG
jgi:1,4-dihydroxy-2-naphthoate octaprenyltransferase